MRVTIWRLTIDSFCLPTFLGRSQLERLVFNKVDEGSAFCWSQNVLIDVRVLAQSVFFPKAHAEQEDLILQKSIAPDVTLY
jgi:hypothetical protein